MTFRFLCGLPGRCSEIGRGWGMGEFHDEASRTKLEQAAVAQTPDDALNGNSPDRAAMKASLIHWRNDNADAMKRGKYELPEEFLGASGFLGDDLCEWLKD